MESSFYGFETLKTNTMDKYELIDKVVAEIAKDKGISEGEVGTYDTLLRVADIAVKNCSIPDVSQQRELLVAYEKRHYTPSEWLLASGQCEKEIDNFLAINCD